MRVLVTGAAGFVGSTLAERLLESGRTKVRAAVRSAPPQPLGAHDVVVRDVGPDTDWRACLTEVDAVVHLAARVHLLDDTAPDPLAAFRRVNTAGTLTLARQAAAAEVKRFVFSSSIKVHGEEGGFTEDDPPDPRDPYAVSKHEAELGLQDLSGRSGLDVVIIRPPLVYGPGVKANFRRLMRWVERGVPLPLQRIQNRRSLVALDNLVDLIEVCLTHPDAANETFLVSDGEDLSTPDLVRHMARAVERPPRLFPVPPSLLLAGARLLGREDVVRRLVGSLYVESSRTRRLLGWSPPIGVDEGLARTVAGHRS